MKKLKLVIGFLIAFTLLFMSACSEIPEPKPPQTNFTLLYVWNDEVQTIDVETGKLYRINTLPQKEGYDFAGLFDSSEGGTQYVNSSGLSVSPFYANTDMVLYVQFTPKEYTFMLDCQDGRVVGERVFMAWYDSNITFLPTEVMNENKEFLGWYTEREGGTCVADKDGMMPGYEKLTSSAYDLSRGSVTLYAHFGAIMYKLRYYTADGEMVELGVESGAMYKLKTIPSKTGYDFDGLYTSETNGVKYVDAKGASIIPFNNESDLMLYPHFTPKKFTFALDYQGGQVGVRSFVADYDSTIAPLPTDVKYDNHTFVGWFTSPNGKGKQISDAYGVIVGHDKVTATNFNITAQNGIITLYAAYDLESYTVSFYFGDEATPDKVKAVYGTPLADIIPNKTIDGKAVLSWSTQKNDAEKKNVFDGEIESDMTLYSCECVVVYNMVDNTPTSVYESCVVDWEHETELNMANHTSRKLNGSVYTDLNIYTSAGEVVLIGDAKKKFNNFNIHIIGDEGHNSLKLKLKNFNFVGNKSSAMDFSVESGFDLTIETLGTCSISNVSDGGNVIGSTSSHAKTLSIIGNGSLSLTAGNGNNSGSTAGTGHNGGTGIYADTVTVDMAGSLNVLGGNGGKGGKGAKGEKGRDAKFLGQTGTDGGQGGPGGTGGNGGASITCSEISIKNVANLTLSAGKYGAGGDGGDGGDAGKGIIGKHYAGPQGATGNHGDYMPGVQKVFTYQQRYYILFRTATYYSWKDAEALCERCGGHLVTITTAEEQQAVSEAVKDFRILIGCTDEAKEGTWAWVTGEPFGYSHWSSGEPNNAQDGQEHYGEMYADGYWNDNKLTSETYYFVIET